MTRQLLVIVAMFATPVFAQTENNAKIFRITSAYTAFPDTGRAKGHNYDKVFYTSAEHYNDSSVLIIIPPHLKTGQHIDIICWFHGWRNNIDSAAEYFELIKQFLASKSNAVLVLPETTKNAPDSYGGKLEQKDVFRNLLEDVLAKLKKEKIIGKKTVPGNIMLAGHSGAFRVMAHILQNGGVEVKEILLFDGLYSQVDKFTNWIQQHESHRFINIYTNKGGTYAVSETMMQGLRNKNIRFINPEEKEISANMLKANNIIFIHSLKEHNDVINRPDHYFKFFIENSPLTR